MTADLSHVGINMYQDQEKKTRPRDSAGQNTCFHLAETGNMDPIFSSEQMKKDEWLARQPH